MFKQHGSGRTWMAGLLAVIMAGAGCEDDGGGDSFDYGDNDRNVCVALGDSIVEGVEEYSGTPFPALLAQKTGKTVVNLGWGGEHSYQGSARIGHALALYKPAHIILLYGANDLMHGGDVPGIVNELRYMATTALANRTKPVLCTLPPMTRHAWNFYDATLVLNAQIRQMAAEEDVPLADLEDIFINRESELLGDGLHPNAEGNRLIADLLAREI